MYPVARAATSVVVRARTVPVSSTLAIKGEHVPYVAPAYSIQVLEIDLK